MSNLIKTSFILLTLTFSLLFAKNGYGYYHYGNDASSYNKLNKSSIIKVANEEVKRLYMERKIPKSWKSIPILEINKSNSDDWKITFKNNKIKKKKYQSLYIFIDVYGKVKGVNYSGR